MRKRPQQARSRDTVDVMVEAGAQVLARKGWAGFNTNEVAATAGVSIGSIYQYFPNKLALLDAIRLRHFEEVLNVLDVTKKRAAGLRTRIAGMVDGLIESHNRCPGLTRVLLDEVPQPHSGAAEVQRFDSAYRQRFRDLVRESTGLEDAARLDLAASVVASAVEGMVHEAARRDAPDDVSPRDEIVSVICGYLRAKRRECERGR